MDGLEFLHKYWTIISAIVVGYTVSVATWVKLNTAIKELSEKDSIQQKELDDLARKIEAEVSSNAKINQQIQIDLQAIKTSIEFIKVELSKRK